MDRARARSSYTRQDNTNTMMMNLRRCIYPAAACSDDDDDLTTRGGGGSSLESKASLASVPSLSVMDLNSPPPLPTLPFQLINLPSLSALAVSGPLLYAASAHLIHVFNTTSLSLRHTFNADHPSSGSVKSISFHDDTRRVFTAHQDSKIRVWSRTSHHHHHRLLAVLPTLSDRLLRLPLPGNYVQVRRHKKQLWLHHNDAVSSLHTTSSLLYSASWDKTLKIWKLSGSHTTCLQSLPAHQDAVNALVVSPQGGVVYTASADTTIRVWAPSNNNSNSKHYYSLVATLQRHKSAVNALALSSDGKLLFSGACDRSILVWEREEEEDSDRYMVVAGALRGHSKPILCLLYLDDHFLLSGSADRTVRIWKRTAGHFSCLTVLEGHLNPVKSLVATSTQTILTVFTGSLDGQIRVWNLNL